MSSQIVFNRKVDFFYVFFVAVAKLKKNPIGDKKGEKKEKKMSRKTTVLNIFIYQRERSVFENVRLTTKNGKTRERSFAKSRKRDERGEKERKRGGRGCKRKGRV